MECPFKIVRDYEHYVGFWKERRGEVKKGEGEKRRN